MDKKELKKIPGVDSLLKRDEIISLIEIYGDQLVKYSIRSVLENIRSNILNGLDLPTLTIILSDIENLCEIISSNSLKRIINATGIILHTNLGRAPLGKFFLQKISPIILGYSNLEFNLSTGKRGKRIDHLLERIKFITGAEDALVVNNNAAAVSLLLRTLVEGKEVIISRGELIEIGDSFRLPEIMTASGVKIVEVGTTNRTKLNDYKKAISKKTKMIFKAHKSNYYLYGFTEDVSIDELSMLAKKYKKIFVYDIGSGLLKSNDKIPNEEPDVKKALDSGADLVTFSCDKLLGGPQAGIIVGGKEIISKIASSPLMRTYRIDKVTIALLNTAFDIYLKSKEIYNEIPLFDMLNKTEIELKKIAEKLSEILLGLNINNVVTKDVGYCGGGALPNYKIKSYSVKLINPINDKNFAENAFYNLLLIDNPILGILRKGEIYFNVLTLLEDEIPLFVRSIRTVL